jgi:E3 ubiquitin-protein ligase BOI-like protein
MDNLNGHSEHANQPQGQQANGLHLDGTNPATFHISFEQHRLQLDQVLQLYVSDFLCAG